MNQSLRTEKNALAIAAYWGKSLEKKDWFSISASENENQIIIYDIIGWPWNDPKDIVNALSSMKDKEVTMKINSPGGSVFDGLSIFNAAMTHGNVNMVIEGLAASIASIIPLAGKTVKAYSSSMVMIHEPWGVVAGNQHDFRNYAEVIGKINTNMIDIYSQHTDIGKREWKDLLEKGEVWWTAKEAKSHGFIDEIISGKSAKAQFDLSMFANVPDNLKPTSNIDIRNIEKILRDGGVSNKQAKTVIARCKDIFTSEIAPEIENDPTEPKAISEIIELTSSFNFDILRRK